MPSTLSEPLLQLPELESWLLQLRSLEKPSEVVELLEPLVSPLLAAAWLLSSAEVVRKKIVRYWKEWRTIQPLLTGDDLKALGIPPGPSYRRILNRLRVARLNGELESRAEELALVKELVGKQKAANHGSKSTPADEIHSETTRLMD